MTPQETVAVLAILSAAYPDKALTEEETSTWERHLANVSFDVAVETAERLIDHLKWFPRISEFRQEAQTTARRHTMSTPALTPAPDDYRGRGLANIARLRAQLRDGQKGPA